MSVLFLEESMEENEENEELPKKKRIRILPLSEDETDDLDKFVDEEDSGDEYVPGICFK